VKVPAVILIERPFIVSDFLVKIHLNFAAFSFTIAVEAQNLGLRVL
jgi:hypothetical protein